MSQLNTEVLISLGELGYIYYFTHTSVHFCGRRFEVRTIFFLRCVGLLFTRFVLLVTSYHHCDLPRVTFMLFSLVYCGYNLNKLIKMVLFHSQTGVTCNVCIGCCMSGLCRCNSRHCFLNACCHSAFGTSIFTVCFISEHAPQVEIA